MLFMDKKMKEIDFSTLVTRWSKFPDRRSVLNLEKMWGSFPMDKGNCKNIIRVKWVSIKRGFEKCTVSGKDRGYRIVGTFVKKLKTNKRANILLWRDFRIQKTQCIWLFSHSPADPLGEATIGGKCASVQTFVPQKAFKRLSRPT